MIDWVIGVPSQADRKVLVESFRRAIDGGNVSLNTDARRR